jgi:beta-lactamase class A
MKRSILLGVAGIIFVALIIFGYARLRQQTDNTAVTAARAEGGAWKDAAVANAEPTQSASPLATPLTRQIEAMGRAFDGEVGIAVRAINAGWTASFNGKRTFPQQSVSKTWVAAAVLDQIDQEKFKLSDQITLTAVDLTIFHQPIRKRIGNGAYAASISELLTFAMTQSDNTANDALFRKVGGKAGVEDFLARKGLPSIQMSTGEIDLQMEIAGMQWNPRFSYGRTFWQVRENVPFDIRSRAITAYVEKPADGATPVAVVDALAMLKAGKLLSRASSDYMLNLMALSKTGPDRLRGNLPDGWQLAHKTGTGQVLKLLATAYNDVGILTSPSGRQYAIAVMIAVTNRPVPERQALMHKAVQAVVACDAGGGVAC